WFYSLSAATGRTLWAVGAGGSISGAAVVVDGVAYAGTFAHRIVGVDAGTGRVLLDFPHGQYVPVSGNGGKLLLHGYYRLLAAAPSRDRRAADAALPQALDVQGPKPDRVPAGDRIRAALLRQQRRRRVRDQRQDGKACLAAPVAPLPGDVAGGRRRHDLRDVP